MCALFGARNDLLIGPSTRLSRSHGKPPIIISPSQKVTDFAKKKENSVFVSEVGGDHPKRETRFEENYTKLTRF